MITPEELLIAAQRYAKNKDEIDLRESIKLAYYYTFHSVSILLKQNQIDCAIQQNGIHEHLIRCLKSIDSKEARQLGDLLKRLKGKRVSACYDLNKCFSAKEAEFHIMECEKCVEYTRKLFPQLS